MSAPVLAFRNPAAKPKQHKKERTSSFVRKAMQLERQRPRAIAFLERLLDDLIADAPKFRYNDDREGA